MTKEEQEVDYINSFNLTSIRASVDFALFGLKSLILVCGASLLTSITFMEILWKQDETKAHLLRGVEFALYFFSSSLILCLISIVLGYIAQSKFVIRLDLPPTERMLALAKYEGWRIGALVTACLALGLFSFGLLRIIFAL